jgi:hypothetical protein
MSKEERKRTFYSYVKGILRAVENGVSYKRAIVTIKNEVDEIEAMEDEEE